MINYVTISKKIDFIVKKVLFILAISTAITILFLICYTFWLPFKLLAKSDLSVAPLVADRDTIQDNVYLISYADGDNIHFQNQNALAQSALNKGIDFIYNYNKKHLDPQFVASNYDIFKEKTGAGYWLWKPYLIWKTLATAPENSYVIWADSGVTIKRSIIPLLQYAQSKELVITDLTSKWFDVAKIFSEFEVSLLESDDWSYIKQQLKQWEKYPNFKYNFDHRLILLKYKGKYKIYSQTKVNSKKYNFIDIKNELPKNFRPSNDFAKLNLAKLTFTNKLEKFNPSSTDDENIYCKLAIIRQILFHGNDLLDIIKYYSTSDPRPLSVATQRQTLINTQCDTAECARYPSQWAGFMIFKNTKSVRNLVKYWLDTCQVKKNLAPTKGKVAEHKDFFLQGHICDESLLAIARYKTGVHGYYIGNMMHYIGWPHRRGFRTNIQYGDVAFTMYDSAEYYSKVFAKDDLAYTSTLLETLPNDSFMKILDIYFFNNSIVNSLRKFILLDKGNMERHAD